MHQTASMRKRVKCRSASRSQFIVKHSQIRAASMTKRAMGRTASMRKQGATQATSLWALRTEPIPRATEMELNKSTTIDGKQTTSTRKEAMHQTASIRKLTASTRKRAMHQTVSMRKRVKSRSASRRMTKLAMSRTAFMRKQGVAQATPLYSLRRESIPPAMEMELNRASARSTATVAHGDKQGRMFSEVVGGYRISFDKTKTKSTNGRCAEPYDKKSRAAFARKRVTRQTASMRKLAMCRTASIRKRREENIRTVIDLMPRASMRKQVKCQTGSTRKGAITSTRKQAKGWLKFLDAFKAIQDVKRSYYAKVGEPKEYVGYKIAYNKEAEWIKQSYGDAFELPAGAMTKSRIREHSQAEMKQVSSDVKQPSHIYQRTDDSMRHDGVTKRNRASLHLDVNQVPRNKVKQTIVECRLLPPKFPGLKTLLGSKEEQRVIAFGALLEHLVLYSWESVDRVIDIGVWTDVLRQSTSHCALTPCPNGQQQTHKCELGMRRSTDGRY
jgi:hypothetical protein